MKKLTLNLIKLYRTFLSPERFGLKVCRFEPSCSRYTHEAIESFGFIKGSIKGLYRILRCNPLFKGGYDPVIMDPVVKD